VQRHKIAQRLTPDLIAKIVAEYRGGGSTPQPAKQYAISTTAMKRLLHHRDVPLRRYHRLTSAEVETAVELRDAGWSVSKIARELHCGDDALRQRLRADGIVGRSRRGDHERE
jgi:hypothetical protein